MHSVLFIIRCCFYLIIFPWIFLQDVHGKPIVENKDSVFMKDFYPGKIAWEIKPGMEWKKFRLDSAPAYRKSYLGNLYEEIDIGKTALPEKPPCAGNLFGLHLLKYYVIGCKGNGAWKIVDDLGKEYMKFSIFYSPDRIYSRQAAMEKFIEMAGCMPHVHAGLFSYQTRDDGGRLLVRKNSVPRRVYFAENGGYALWIDAFSPLRLSNEETIQVTGDILNALMGNRKFGYFPERAQIIEKRNQLSYKEREQLIHQLRNQGRSMSPLAHDVLYDYGKDMVKALNWEAAMEKVSEDEKIPNVSRGIGTIQWIRRHLNVSFTPGPSSDETHVDGVTGTFFANKGNRDYPVEYMIAHLSSKKLAMIALFSLQAWKAVDGPTKEDDIKKVAEMTQVHSGLVGDMDLCLKPVLNGLGVPIPDSEYAWICFVRGNTVVMLKSLNLQVSVLPLARIIDEALKKNMELYETPEVVR